MGKLTFDPNEKNKYVWATYIPRRGGTQKFKVHTNRAQAMQAITYNKQGILFQFVVDRWIEIVNIEDFSELEKEICDICHNSTLQPDYFNKMIMVVRGKVQWVKKSDPLRLAFHCQSCQR